MATPNSMCLLTFKTWKSNLNMFMEFGDLAKEQNPYFLQQKLDVSLCTLLIFCFQCDDFLGGHVSFWRKKNLQDQNTPGDVRLEPLVLEVLYLLHLREKKLALYDKVGPKTR